MDRALAPYADLAAAWRGLRRTHELTVREVACAGAPRTLLLVDIVRLGAPVVALAAGVHGDEPAAPWALLGIVRDGLLDPAFGYRIWPCTNPTGYERGTRENAEGADVNRSFHRGGKTPEARAIVTANRDRTFELSLDLHEDFEADGFYCYEPLVAGTAPYGRAMVAAVDEAGLPVQDLDESFDLAYPPHARHVRTLERGRVLPNAAAETALFSELPYSLHLLRRAARRVLTLESPRKLSWEQRLAVHRIAVTAALAALRDGLKDNAGT